MWEWCDQPLESSKIEKDGEFMMKKRKKHHGLMWWVFISWWWLPIKWMYYTIPVWFVKTIMDKGKTGAEPVCSQNKQEIPSSVHSAVSPKILQNSDSDLDIVIPSRKDGAPLIYNYRVKITVTDEDCLRRHHAEKDWSFTPKDINGDIHLFLGNDDIGILVDRVDMLRDWLRRGDPFLLCFENLSEENGCFGHIAFYRDKRKGNEWREQTVVSLISYKSGEKQEVIEYLNEGDEVQIEEEDDDNVIITSNDEMIGKLPKKYVRRCVEEGVHSAFIEKLEYDEGGKMQPFIRIYWISRASK